MSRMAYQLSPRLSSVIFFICGFLAKNQNKMRKIKTLFIIHFEKYLVERVQGQRDLVTKQESILIFLSTLFYK